MMFVPTEHWKYWILLMVEMRRIGMIVVAGSLLLPLGACSRTSDGTVVMDKPVALPSLSLMPMKPLIPSWMQRKKPEDAPVVASNFPPPPARKVAKRRMARPPVVATGSGKLDCENVSEGGRVRMVCQ